MHILGSRWMGVAWGHHKSSSNYYEERHWVHRLRRNECNFFGTVASMSYPYLHKTGIPCYFPNPVLISYFWFRSSSFCTGKKREVKSCSTSCAVTVLSTDSRKHFSVSRNWALLWSEIKICHAKMNLWNRVRYFKNKTTVFVSAELLL